MRGRRGFSLIVVLLLSLIGLAVIGVAMNIVAVNTGAGITASTINRNYNLLVNEVEIARAWIIASLDNGEIPEREGGVLSAKTITSADQLLVVGGELHRTLTPQEMGLYGVGGGSGAVTVKVYDMQYYPEALSNELKDDSAEINRLPPSLPLFVEQGPKDDQAQSAPVVVGGGSLWAGGGVYLIRASLEINGVTSSTVELALIGAKSDTAVP
jgi:hypothetical protein